ncbi:phenylalanine--tRNA ligase subunit beta [uncultured Eudoraea sp.]|uniref:phenylalanine--tRNA ligase subunit beta n=1 Tax=uncultured Eudoraea sp. TaxID=1035614 RepID=UPI00262227CA|nr:phenylalanine--tRNA ligase subunit beta [uncultured Eudoraea sp.]
MKISYNWLKQFLKLDWEAEKTGELLTNLGLEVEGISLFESIPGSLEGIVVGHVLSCEKHPDADRLKLTTVDIGLEKPVQIVCGAPNVAEGQMVPVATIGSTLHTNEGETLKIKKGKIRGVESHGMICAEDELGLGDNHDGIMILSEGLIPGTACSEIFKIENDEVFEIGLTPNRADAMSHHGVARDLKAGLIQRDIHTELITPSVSNFNVENRSLKIDVSVENNNLAPRYCGVTLSNLIVQPSPDWLKNRLRAIGLSPINNVVDATNYVLHELGQPLHAFDADRILGKKIIVKTLPSGTKFMTLDGEERILDKEDLMICDDEKPMCIAGVFGGINTGVTENTKSIFLESAYFDPVSIRKTAKRHGLNTDASFRFERGVDINNVEYCLRRAALLIREITGGDITSDIIDLYPRKKDDYQVFLSFEKIEALIGQKIPADTIKSILASLDIKVKNATESGLGLLIPFYRVDVQREVDVIEEILRVYGYNNIDSKEKLNASIASTSRFEDHKLEKLIGDLLASRGFYEILTNSLTTPGYDKLIDNNSEESRVTILNPLSTDLSVLRQNMLFNALETVSYNINRKKQNLNFFEFGKTYQQIKSKYIESKHLSLIVTGIRNENSWIAPSKPTDFYFLKAAVELVLERLGITNYESFSEQNDIFHEGLSLNKNKTELVSFGMIQKAILKEFDIKQDVFYADFNWDALSKIISKNEIIFEKISRFPEVKRDLALLLDTGISFDEIKTIAYDTERNLLKSITLFDVYTGKNLPPEKKSYALGFTIGDPHKTLTDKQIDKIMKKLQQRFEKELGAVLR